MKITISGDGMPDWVVPTSLTSTAQVRLGFNPSMLSEVDGIKLLAAAMITLMEPHRDARQEAGRCAAIAITKIEEAAMWAVKAVTSSSAGTATTRGPE